MIDLYFWTTPNGYKVSILLEELELPYRVVPVHIGKGEQFEPAFLDLSPNNKIPAIVDHDGPQGQPLGLFESGAIMMYLAEKADWRFMPRDVRQRYDVIKWLTFQCASVAPMLGQAHHFRKYAPQPVPYAVERYTREAGRLYGVVDRRLQQVPFLAGEEYSIADMAMYPWLRAYRWQGQDIENFPYLKRWYLQVRARPAVQRGLAVLSEKVSKPGETPTGERWDNLFGARQFDAR